MVGTPGAAPPAAFHNPLDRAAVHHRATYVRGHNTTAIDHTLRSVDGARDAHGGAVGVGAGAEGERNNYLCV